MNHPLDPQTIKQIGHEARKPLVSLLCTADLLLMGIEGELSEQVRQDVEAMRGNAERALENVDKMLSTYETLRRQLRD